MTQRFLARDPAMSTLWGIRTLDALYDPEAPGADMPAIICVQSDAAPVVITRHEFCDRAGRAALALYRLGIKPQGNRGGHKPVVLIAHTQGLDSIFAFWGCVLLNLVPAMMPTLT